MATVPVERVEAVMEVLAVNEFSPIKTVFEQAGGTFTVELAKDTIRFILERTFGEIATFFPDISERPNIGELVNIVFLYFVS